MAKILPPAFYLKKTEWVAKNLLGKILVHVVDGKRRSGIIVETEAYLGGEDPACHSFGFRKSTRNQSLFLRGGHSYVYFIYGMYFCFNVVTRKANAPEAVLIRALEPLEGIEEMANSRRTNIIKDIASGPGKLCTALGINRNHDGLDLRDDRLFIEDYERFSKGKIEISARIGINVKNAGHSWPLRFYLANNPHVSRTKISSKRLLDAQAL